MRQFMKISMLTLLTTSLMFAQGRGAKAGNAGWWMDDLDLTAKQQETITKMQTDFQKSQIKTRSDLASAEVELRALMQDMDGNAKQIKAKQAEINQIRTQLQNAGVDHRNAIRKVLTPEQQVLFDQQARRGMRDGEGFRRGEGRRGGAPGQRGIHSPGSGGGRR
ncbi:MAG: Spy/CpxP family protein refolding chaperone [Lentisphaeria bacterium]|nr:Spy/CpxP family protein refolding chaperone [Candidatus Neomarinimicrobiota bacterium]MCF7842120.1 Spy/CpxP family protein refolding chaperone [Lentisphaeria bacterium]